MAKYIDKRSAHVDGEKDDTGTLVPPIFRDIILGPAVESLRQMALHGFNLTVRGKGYTHSGFVGVRCGCGWGSMPEGMERIYCFAAGSLREVELEMEKVSAACKERCAAAACDQVPQEIPESAVIH